MSTLSDLIAIITEENNRVTSREIDDRPNLTLILIQAIHKALVEIKNGGDSDEFKDLTILYLIVDGTKARYNISELRTYIRELKSDEPDDEDLD